MSSNIPFDVQVQIMERLPVKPLIRFRSVCKAWKSFIDCSEFIAAYSFRHTQSQHLMIRYEVGYPEENEVKYVCFVDDDTLTFPQQKFDLTVPPLVQLTKTKTVIGSSHGLLCLTDDYYPTCRTQMAILWNPSIRKSIAVTVPSVVDQRFSYVIGFGVCPYTNDPKLVQITYIDDIRKMESISCIPCQVMVFTLSSGEWTPSCSNQLPRKSIQIEKSSQVAIGQFIYWNAYDINYEDDEFHTLIISFDLSTDEFREVDLPDSLHQTGFFTSKLRESLVLLKDDINITTNGNKKLIHVWMMEHGDRKAFTKIFTINAPVASVVRQSMGFRKSGELIIEMQDDVDVLTSALVVYEPCFEDIKDLGIRGSRYSFVVSSYTESLLLLNHDDGHIIECGAVKR